MAGIRDVAAYAGVGVGTVSRALNKTGYVSEETKRKIDEAVKALNYQPNELARNLYRNKKRYDRSNCSRSGTIHFLQNL